MARHPAVAGAKATPGVQGGGQGLGHFNAEIRPPLRLSAPSQKLMNQLQDFKMNIKLLFEFFLLTAVIITLIQAAILFGWRYSIRGIRAILKVLKTRLAGLGEK